MKVCHQADLCHLGKMSAQSYRTSGKHSLVTGSPHQALSLPGCLGCKYVGSEWISTVQSVERNPTAGEPRFAQPE